MSDTTTNDTSKKAVFNVKGDHFRKVMEGELDLSPATALLGWEMLEYDSDNGTVTIKFDAKPEFCNAGGIIHGGFLAAMLDDTLAPALAVTLEDGQYTPTIELKINYLRSASVGPIIGKGKVVRRGRNIGFAEGHLEDEEGQVLVTATGTFMIVSPKE